MIRYFQDIESSAGEPVFQRKKKKVVLPTQEKTICLQYKGMATQSVSGLPEMVERERAITEELMPRFFALRLASDTAGEEY